ncbi:MAG: class I SAM-dependent methyltransferase [Gemmatimonadaceae bacterium]
MIRLEQYDLSEADRAAVATLMRQTGDDPTVEVIWAAMDRAWHECGCSNAVYDAERYASFYQHSVWLLNGMFIEQDAVSLQHRRAMTRHVAASGAGLVVDFGGGFGSLARMIAAQAPAVHVEICDPFPPRHGVTSCRQFPNIAFVPHLTAGRYDALVCTDVLEHLHDPLATLAEMVDAVRVGGQLLIANHFYPVIACHIPSAFHLRHSFSEFCERMGLRLLGPCEGSHATLYERAAAVVIDWEVIRRAERRSRALFPLRDFREAYLRWWEERLRRVVAEPTYYPRKIWRRIKGSNA